MNLRVTSTISEQDANEIHEGLLEYNLSKIEDKDPRDLGVFFEDENGISLRG